MSPTEYPVTTHNQQRQQIATEVSKNPLGIGYVGLAYSKGESYRSVKVEGVSAKASKVAKAGMKAK